MSPRDLLSKSANQSHKHATRDHRTTSLQSTLALQLGVASVAQKVFCEKLYKTGVQ